MQLVFPTSTSVASYEDSEIFVFVFLPRLQCLPNLKGLHTLRSCGGRASRAFTKLERFSSTLLINFT